MSTYPKHLPPPEYKDTIIISTDELRSALTEALSDAFSLDVQLDQRQIQEDAINAIVPRLMRALEEFT